jgi:tRNA uridine 5-carboxymethylaminomethyl modification enzyme
MVDDLTSRGVTEPYRMFTSRAEYRLSLRADNADVRLTGKAIELGSVGSERATKFGEYMKALDNGRELLRSRNLTPNEANGHGLKLNKDGQRRTAYELLAYPDQSLSALTTIWPELGQLSPKVGEALEIEASYAVYMNRQAADIHATHRDEARVIPQGFDFSGLPGLSNELKLKLTAASPGNLAQASKVDGMTPAALALILALLRKEEAAPHRVKRVL